MEAKDLMIGDWVRIEHYKYEYLNCIGQIAGINECEGSIEPRTFNVIYEKDGKKGLNVGVSKRNVFPIPITKEILEKNGFGDSFATNEKIFKCEDFEIWIDFKEQGYWACIKNKVSDLYFEGNKRYVHELQHALRLCGIDKKIVLND